MTKQTPWRVALCLAVLPACGGSDDAVKPNASGASGGAIAGQGGAAGATGAAATTGGGGTSGGAGAVSASGGANAGAGGAPEFVCVSPGVTLANGACYLPCEYAPAYPPRYENPAGNCSKIGWKCSALQHCNPNTRCAIDASCEKLAGPGWSCVRSLSPQIDAQCAFRCDTDADCPVSNGATATPYTCQATGDPVVKVCRF